MKLLYIIEKQEKFTMNTLKHKKIKASNFDAAFEQGDVTEHLNLKSAKVRYPVQRLSIDFPKNIIKKLDNVTAEIAVGSTAINKAASE